jgi:hypothetical protein
MFHLHTQPRIVFKHTDDAMQNKEKRKESIATTLCSNVITAFDEGQLAPQRNTDLT